MRQNGLKTITEQCKICDGTHFLSYAYNNHLNRIRARFLKHYLATIVLLPVKIVFPKILRLIPWLNRHALKTIFSTFPTHKIFVCQNCGYGAYNKKLSPALIIEYYRVAYWQSRDAEVYGKDDLGWQGAAKSNRSDTTVFLKDARARGQYNFVKRHLDSFTEIDMLEIGAASALMSRLIRHLHKGEVRLDVIEPGEQWTSYYKLRDINLVGESFPNGSLGKTYNYIHGSHWLEHVANLEQVMSGLNKALCIGGLVFIEVPHCSEIYYLTDIGDSPHVHFFTKKSLTLLFNKFGFEAIKMDEYGLTWKEDKNLRDTQPSYCTLIGKANNSDDKDISRKGGQHCRALFRKIGSG